jgi:nucleotide-binding universal stress UspA family protein
MKKVLVTTDFSSNSRAGLRFAIQLASQGNYRLTFFHSYNLTRPSGLDEQAFESFERSETAKIQKKLEHFVNAVYKSTGISPANPDYVIRDSFLASSNIMQYAADNNYNYICISRRGESRQKKLFGTNTSNLINQSEVPVIAVPPGYRRSQISKILYASDLSDLKKEVGKVVDFARPLNAEVELLHFEVPSGSGISANLTEESIQKLSGYPVRLSYDKFDFVKNLSANLEQASRKAKPSMMVMFTSQNRSFFKKLLLSSSSAEYSFKSAVPLLVFPKG